MAEDQTRKDPTENGNETSLNSFRSGQDTIFHFEMIQSRSLVVVVKNLPTNAGEVRDVGSIPGSGRFPEGGYVNPPQYSCLENPTDTGAWWAIVHGVTQS